MRTTIKATIQVKKEFERPGERVRVHLPLPKACQQQSEIEILATSPEATYIAAEDAPQRTLCFETILKEIKRLQLNIVMLIGWFTNS